MTTSATAVLHNGDETTTTMMTATAKNNKKKSKAQIQRMIRRAEARGEVYHHPIESATETIEVVDEQQEGGSSSRAAVVGEVSPRIQGAAATATESFSSSAAASTTTRSNTTSSPSTATAVSATTIAPKMVGQEAPQDHRDSSTAKIPLSSSPPTTSSSTSTTAVQDEEEQQQQEDDNEEKERGEGKQQQDEEDHKKKRNHHTTNNIEDAIDQYYKGLQDLQNHSEQYRAKERRSMKRKLDAIVVEQTGLGSISDVLDWMKKTNMNTYNATITGIIATHSSTTRRPTENSNKSNNSKGMNPTDGQQQEEKQYRNDKSKAPLKRKREGEAEVHTKDKNINKKNKKNDDITTTTTGNNPNKESKVKATTATSKAIPYILFFGQLAFETTKEDLLQHIRTELMKDIDEQILKNKQQQSLSKGKSGGNAISILQLKKKKKMILEETIQIRLLTKPKTKISRGMAFVEVSNPDMMYMCMKLHHTMLHGRRMNIERTMGGHKNSILRQEKLKQYKVQQDQYMSEKIDEIFQEYYINGQIQKNELDDGVILVCKRHSAHLVQTALERYIESNGSTKDNPSAYLSFLLGKLATEGIYQFDNDDNHDNKNHHNDNDRFIE